MSFLAWMAIATQVFHNHHPARGQKLQGRTAVRPYGLFRNYHYAAGD
ncbi:MAG: hypothetical protein NZ772_12315 [Cyanobacteria bacterium]|nr:hypothetical protein [Cyanobacteriota bacterium]MDW8202105.1 hypothetical protein [Cyanobacteriota bacterium SKYGB_h_bin112]